MVKLLLLVLLILLEEEKEDDDVDVNSEEEIQAECVELLLLGVDNDVLDLKVLLSLLLVDDDDDDSPSSPQPLEEWKTWLPTVFIAIDHIMMLS